MNVILFISTLLCILLLSCAEKSPLNKKEKIDLFWVTCSRETVHPFDTIQLPSKKQRYHFQTDSLLFVHYFELNNDVHEIRKYYQVDGQRTHNVFYELDSLGIIQVNQLSFRAYSYLTSSNDSLNRILEYARIRISYYTELERMNYFEHGLNKDRDEIEGIERIHRIMRPDW